MSEIKLANRIVNAERSLQRLEEAAEAPLDERKMNLDATVHRFNTAFETLTKTLDAYLESVHHLAQQERGATKYKLIQTAFNIHLIDDEQVWVKILRARNTTVHEYDEEQAMNLYQAIKSYIPHLRKLLDTMRGTHPVTKEEESE